MNLNCLYFRHQLFSMRAAAATDRRSRVHYQARADKIGKRIEGFQERAGAQAAASWGPLRLAGAQASVVQP